MSNYDMNSKKDTMSSNIDGSLNVTSILKSVYIPRVFANITTDFIAETFENLNLGIVERIESVSRPGANTYMAFVYFDTWNTDNKAAIHLAERVNNTFDKGRTARIVYDDPWYWILLPNKSYKKNSADIEQKIDILTKTIDNIMLRIKIIDEKNKENEKKINNELNDLNSTLFNCDIKKQELVSCKSPKLYRQTAGCLWPFEPPTLNNTDNQSQIYSTEVISSKIFENPDDMPINRPKLYRQNAISCLNNDGDDIIADVENGMLKPSDIVRQTQIVDNKCSSKTNENIRNTIYNEIATLQKMKAKRNINTDPEIGH